MAFDRFVKKTYRTLRRPFEWLLIGVALLVIPRLDRMGVVRLGNFLAYILFYLAKRDREISRDNLRVMFGARLTPKRADVIIKRSYQHLMRVLLNVFWLSRNTRERVMELAYFPPGVLELLKQESPVVLLSGHIGNWEILTQALVANGVPVMSVAKKVGSASMTRRLIRVRSKIGQRIVPTAGALRPLVGALRQGISVGLLIDQHVGINEGGTWLKFFGLPASFSLAPVALARKHKVPIFLGWSRPLKDGRYRIEYDSHYTCVQGVTDADRMQQVVAALERIIRRYPSFWCLNYRRWRYILSDPALSRYPSYAKPVRPA